MYKNVLIATDGSDLSQKAVQQGLELAKVLSARVTVMTVTEPLASVAPAEVMVTFPAEEYEAATATNAARIVAQANDAAKTVGIACETLHVKDAFPAEAIIATASERGCDLIVMASHGRRGLTRLLLGSQANKVVTQSTVPVLICR